MRPKGLLAPTAVSLMDAGYRFRALIDTADRSARGDQFEFFPAGSCGAVSEMFGKHLIDTYGIDSVYVSGRSSSGASHAWIECLGLIIDLTGDQFLDDPLPPVFVSSDQHWHARRWSEDQLRSSISEILRDNVAQCHWAWGIAYRHLAVALGSEAA
ncbi:hypothetical protein CU048_13735 [Beijerinckiaceae bacterium]|nr:hypothetical protein CU048_13735 [Beijerinckiaceae bacterium]